ncbi:MAG: hypothetical protein IPK04_11770 [Bdellovibrionales bacterium]|nr:hypothetical protein [Bdellovibrionales bacterium]
MKSQIENLLKQLAVLKSIPFCYGCYSEARSGVCAQCGSDDLMRMVSGVGCEYGYDWIFTDILSGFDPINDDELFEESMRDCYPETTQIGWLKYDTVLAIKELDPVSWSMAKSEWIDSEESDERIVSFDNGSSYYDVSSLQEELEAALAEFTESSP